MLVVLSRYSMYSSLQLCYISQIIFVFDTIIERMCEWHYLGTANNDPNLKISVN